ncbi:hypothetical protein O9992_09780 [Vibrio lentus]|nr:hypothetical protein [Vibrio lentus]
MAQLVDENVTLINTMTNVVMDREGVIEVWYPTRVDHRLPCSTMGDKVDNIPGVPGVGDKTATALLQGIGSIQRCIKTLMILRRLVSVVLRRWLG